MAITSVGYGGTVTYPDYGKGVVAPGRYSFDGAQDFRPSRRTTGADRTVRLQGGTAQGWGIRDTESSSWVDVQLGSIGSGSRWDLVVLRRDWSADETTVEVVQGGSSRAIPSRNTDPGVVDDQPVALVRVEAGESWVTDVVDLRCWAADGGLVAVDPMVLEYLSFPGTRVSVGDTTYTRVLSAGGSASWDVKGPVSDTGWVSSAITNSGFSGTRRYRIQGGTGWFQAQGSRTGGDLSSATLRLLTFGNSSFRPTQGAYGVCYVGDEIAGRAYVDLQGRVEVAPFNIRSGQNFQVYITWPVG